MSDFPNSQDGLADPCYRVRAGGPLQGELRVASDKSISHRAVILGALSEGRTVIDKPLLGQDVMATIRAFKQMGVSARISGDARQLVIDGVGLAGLQPPSGALEMGNSGTAMRLLAGVLCGQPFGSRLVGDESLSQRPMGRVLRPLQAMGAIIKATDEGHPPLCIEPAGGLCGIDYQSPIASAQVKSSVLLAGLYAAGETRVTEPAPSRDHSERMLSVFGARLEQGPCWSRLTPGRRLTGQRLEVPADISSAAFFMVGASICPGSRICLRAVGVNPTRVGVIEILTAMGADIELRNRRFLGAEPIADVHVRHAPLHGAQIGKALVAAAIDEFPALFVAAACAVGVTKIEGAGELRVKESDRIAVMSTALERLGIRVRETADGAMIEGGVPSGGAVASGGDHRCAMALSMLGMVSRDSLLIHDCRNVATSYPHFVDQARKLGLDLTVETS